MLVALAGARAGVAAAEPVLQDTVVASGTVSSATTMALAPDGRLFVAEQAGRLRVISAPEGTRVVVALRRGGARLAARRVTVDADGVRVVRLRVRVARRATLRVVAAATGVDGQRSRVSRRIVLTRG